MFNRTKEISKLRSQLKKLERIADIWDTNAYNKAVNRSRTMSTHSLLDWIDRTGNDMYKAALDYRNHGRIESLEELKLAISYLQAMVEELEAQHSVLE